MDEIRPQLAAFKPRFAALRVTGATADERRELAEARRDILLKMERALAAVDNTLLEYGQAFAALADGQAGAFRAFLLKAPEMFIPMGEAVGVIRHIEAFWKFRFPDKAPPAMNVDEAIEVLHDFEVTVAGVEFMNDDSNEVRIAS